MYIDHELHYWIHFPKYYFNKETLLTTFLKLFSEKNNLFYLKEYLRMEDL